MAIYDLGTASLAANGEVTGVGTTWKAPLTLIRVGATIVFKTEPVQIYTISEIISDTRINVYNPNSETVTAGTGYAILAHDGITVQGLAQDVAETLRYYQSKETSLESLLQFIGQDSFDWPRFEQLATQSITGAAEALASQVAAAESAATAVSARNTTTAARDATIDAINNAGDASTLVTLAGWGIGNVSNVLGSLDFQTFNFIVGGNYRVAFSNCTNVPPSLIAPSNSTLVISVEGGAGGSTASTNMQISTYTTADNNFRRYSVSYQTSSGNRNYFVRESIYLPGGNAVGGANAQRVRGLLDVYSKSEVGDTFYPNIRGNVNAPNTGFIFQPYTRYVGDHDLRYINGGIPKSVKRLKKTGNATITLDPVITGGSNPGSVTVDAVGYVNPANADPDGTTFPASVLIDGVVFDGDDAGGEVGLMILQGQNMVIRNCGASNTKMGMFFRDVWSSSITDTNMFGQFRVGGGTSMTITNCAATVQDYTVSPGAFRIENLQYSMMNSCATDGTVSTAYYFNGNNGLTVNNCGSEVPYQTQDTNYGTAAHFEVSNEMILNNFYTLPAAGSNILFSIMDGNDLVFNNPMVYGSPDNWSRDFWLLGTGNKVVVNGGTFGNTGRMPLVATNAAGNTFIYNSSDGNSYVAKTTGPAITVNLEPKYETRDLSSTSKLIFSDTGEDTGATRNFRLRKNGNIVIIDFTFSLNGYTGQAGSILINGLPYPSRFFSSGSVGYVTGINASIGPLSCFIEQGGTEIKLFKTSATTGNSTSLTSGDITATARVSGTITYQISSTNFD